MIIMAGGGGDQAEVACVVREDLQAEVHGDLVEVVHGDLVEVDAHAVEEVQDVEDPVVALVGLVAAGGGEGAPVAEGLASSLYS